jgi:RNA polymerase sigma factor (sigma-70 family)
MGATCARRCNCQDPENTAHTALAQALAIYDPKRGRLPSLFWCIFHRRVIDEWRKTCTHPPLQPLNEQDAESALVQDEPEVYANDRLSCFCALLASMPSDLVNLLILYKGYGLNAKALAARFGVSLGVMKMKLFRALGKLKKILENAGYKKLEDVDRMGDIPMRSSIRMAQSLPGMRQPRPSCKAKHK